MKSSVPQTLGVRHLLVGRKNCSLSGKSCETSGANNPGLPVEVSRAIGEMVRDLAGV